MLLFGFWSTHKDLLPCLSSGFNQHLPQQSLFQMQITTLFGEDNDTSQEHFKEENGEKDSSEENLTEESFEDLNEKRRLKMLIPLLVPVMTLKTTKPRLLIPTLKALIITMHQMILM
jgi:hypothetical protein